MEVKGNSGVVCMGRISPLQDLVIQHHLNYMVGVNGPVSGVERLSEAFPHYSGPSLLAK